MSSQTRIGRYEVISVLGRGAMGTVYKAVDPLTERAVAIKTINLDLPKEERAEFGTRFYREASAGRLNHANIVTIYEIGEADDIAYVAMEYVEGESLRKRLDSGVQLPLEKIASVAAHVADALNYAHENHVVHRDIKPGNIMITPGHEVKVMDFGIAQIPTGSHKQLGTLLGILGSPRYMAPEQMAGGNTDGRTDIFALGVVLYEMLSGVTPFNGDTLGTIIDEVLKQEPVPPSTLNPRVPPAFDRIISRALAKRPRDRYQTALEFARDLRNPDAAIARKARRATASAKPEQAVQASRTPAEEPAPSSARGERIKEKIASLRGRARAHRPLLLALPLLIIVAFAMYPQGDPARSDLAPSPAAQAGEVTPAVSARPTVTAEPAVSVEPTASAEATVTAEAAVTAATAGPTATARPKVSTRPTVTARPRVSPKSDVSESGTAPPPVSVTPEKATMALAIAPWGEVYVDGNSVGVSPPLVALQLEPGEHDVEIRNQAFAPYRETVNLEPGKSLKIRHKFR